MLPVGHTRPGVDRDRHGLLVQGTGKGENMGRLRNTQRQAAMVLPVR